jgi:hypothetical protein
MEWMKIGQETYEIEGITTQFSVDQKHMDSVVFVRNEVAEQKIMELYDSGTTFDFETKKWKFIGTRMKSITFDTTGMVVTVVSRSGGMKSKSHERDKRIDELLGDETSEDRDDIITN